MHVLTLTHEHVHQGLEPVGIRKAMLALIWTLEHGEKCVLEAVPSKRLGAPSGGGGQRAEQTQGGWASADSLSLTLWVAHVGRCRGGSSGMPFTPPSLG